MVSFAVGVVVGAAVTIAMAALYHRRRGARMREYEARARQTERLAELGRLTGGLAHEIRNPLSTMKVNLQLLAEDLRGVESGQQFEDIKRHGLHRVATLQSEADRLTETLDSFLRYTGKYEVSAAPCDANEVVASLLDFFEPQARGTDVRLRGSLCADPLPCRLDQALFKQALLNLLVNAQQAMASGGDLIVRTERRGTDARIEITDTGPGVADDVVGRMFDVFYSTRPGGTGLGLPTARRIVEDHHGTIEVHSEPGRGTSFTVRLPLDSSA